MSLRNVLIATGSAVLLVLGYLLLWPTPIDPAAWSPPPAPDLQGRFERNNELAAIERLADGVGLGPEGLAFDSEGWLYTGLEDGRIIRLRPDGSGVEVWAEVPGRPFGLDFDHNGNLIVAGGDAGLLALAPDGSQAVLASGEGGQAFQLVNGVAVARNDLIYFTDSSHRFGPRKSTYDLMEHRPNGRLLVYDPGTGETQRLMGELYHPNGIAISADQTYLLVAETGRYRVLRYYLGGGQAGESQVFIDNLPGFPDGISAVSPDLFWLALVSPRLENVDQILLPRPFLRDVIMRLPDAALPEPENHGFVLGLSNQAEVLHNLQDPSGGFAQISSVLERDGYLYLDSLAEDALGRIPVPR